MNSSLRKLKLINEGKHVSKQSVLKNPTHGSTPHPLLIWVHFWATNTMRVAIQLHFGTDIFIGHRYKCGTQVDQKGRHELSCFDASRFCRHASVNEVIKSFGGSKYSDNTRTNRYMWKCRQGTRRYNISKQYAAASSSAENTKIYKCDKISQQETIRSFGTRADEFIKESFLAKLEIPKYPVI